jgi:hypothetical protein
MGPFADGHSRVDWMSGRFVFACANRLRLDHRSPEPVNLRAATDFVKDLAMESSDLFSHPYVPEAVPDKESSTDPVEAPVFSDRPKSATTADTPPTS